MTRSRLAEHGPIATIVAVSASLNCWALSRMGWGNGYYSAAVRSMGENWHAFFYNSFDSQGFVTVDKPPFSLWVQVLSTKIFGFHQLSVLLPGALGGALSVWLLYVAIGRSWGRTGGLVAAAALAVTPVAVVVNHSNNTDAILVVLMVGAAAAGVEAARRGRLRWLLLAVVLAGCAMTAKMLAAVFVMPGLLVAYLWCAPLAWKRRVTHAAAAAVVLAISGLWWFVAVEATPASQRPYIGSTQTNSVFELAFERNGVNQVEGNGGVFGPGGPGGTYPGGFPGVNGLPFPAGANGLPFPAGANGLPFPAGAGSNTGQFPPGANGESPTGAGPNAGPLPSGANGQPFPAGAGSNTGEFPTGANGLPFPTSATGQFPPGAGPSAGQAPSEADGQLPTGAGPNAGPLPSGANGQPFPTGANGQFRPGGDSSTGQFPGGFGAGPGLDDPSFPGGFNGPFAGGRPGAGGPGGIGGLGFGGGTAGVARLANEELGTQLGWTLPLAVFGLIGGLSMSRLRPGRQLAPVIVFGSWFLGAAIVFSMTKGIVHPYYLANLAPPAAALVGIGVATMRDDLGRRHPRALLGAAALAATAVADWMIWRRVDWRHPFGATLAVVVGVAALGVVVGWFTRRTSAVGLLAVGAAALAVPAAWVQGSLAAGVSGPLPYASPLATGLAVPTSTGVVPNGGFRFPSADPAALTAYLDSRGDSGRWLVAVQSAAQAEELIIETGRPVMALGGFSGSDPILDATGLAAMVHAGDIRFFLVPGEGGGLFGGGSFGGGPGGPFGGSGEQTNWVTDHCLIVDPADWNGGTSTTTEGQGTFPGGPSSSVFDLYDCATA